MSLTQIGIYLPRKKEEEKSISIHSAGQLKKELDRMREADGV